jgi:hypothetical protein
MVEANLWLAMILGLPKFAFMSDNTVTLWGQNDLETAAAALFSSSSSLIISYQQHAHITAEQPQKDLFVFDLALLSSAMT